MSFMLYDDIKLDDEAKVRITGDGYLVARPRVARTGIQIYAGKEVGKPQLERVRVFRPESAVFDKAAMQSFAHRPVTLNHPPEQVTADNHRKYAVGHTDGEVARDGEFVRVSMLMADAAAVRKYRAGQRQLSMGYTCDLAFTPGRTDAGEEYDAVQHNIRGNHLAVVSVARGGDSLTIGDDIEGEVEMVDKALVMVTVDGVGISVDDVSASVIRRAMERMDATIKSLKERLEGEEKEKDEAKRAKDAIVADSATKIAAKDAEIATLKKQVEDGKMSPAQIDAMLAARADVFGKARAILGDKLVVKDQTMESVRRQVVDAKLGDVAKGWTDDQVSVSFATIAKDVKADEPSFSGGSHVYDAARALSGASNGNQGAVAQAYQAYDADIGNAWKGDANKSAAH